MSKRYFVCCEVSESRLDDLHCMNDVNLMHIRECDERNSQCASHMYGNHTVDLYLFEAEKEITVCNECPFYSYDEYTCMYDNRTIPNALCKPYLCPIINVNKKKEEVE